MKFVFQVNASNKIGNGHIVRCISLAEGLKSRGFDCLFVGDSYSGHILKSLSEKGFPYFCSHLEKDKNTFIQDVNPDWIVIDDYESSKGRELRLKKFCKKILVIDDLANREHYCDLLIDQNIVKGMYTRYDCGSVKGFVVATNHFAKVESLI